MPAPRHAWRPRRGDPDRARRAPLRRRARAEALRDAAGRRPCRRAGRGRTRTGPRLPRRGGEAGLMSDGIRLRTATAADRDALIDLIRALNTDEAAITGDRLVTRAAAEAYYIGLLERVAKQEGRLVVAEADRRIIGMLGLIVQED